MRVGGGRLRNGHSPGFSLFLVFLAAGIEEEGSEEDSGGSGGGQSCDSLLLFRVCVFLVCRGW